MKNLKTSLISILIALGAVMFGQVEQSSRFENLHDNYLSLSERNMQLACKEPVVYRSYVLKQADVVHEENPGLEAWMVSPFANIFAEPNPAHELWMISPFKSYIAQGDLRIEEWMTTPFTNGLAEPELKIESWMTAAF